MKRFAGIAFLILMIGSAASLAQKGDQRQSTDTAEKKDDRSGDEVESGRKAERLRAMQKIAEELTLEMIDAKGKTTVELVDGARFRYSSAVNRCFDGTAWLWGTDRRPVALLTLSAYQHVKDGPCVWSYELTSLATEELSLTSPDGWQWKPEKAGLDFQPLPDAPAPAEGRARRQRQIKDVARRFDAYGMYGPAQTERSELHILPTPIAFYTDERAGVREGALFFVAGGTDPEALLAIELSGKGHAGDSWKYAFNRVTAGEIHVRLDGKEVWSCHFQPDRTERSPYFIITRPMPRELGID
jgi:hypothetical protein